jgi:rhodanese-related sulfurtransferase
MIANRASRGVAVCRAIKAWEKMQPELYDMFKTGEMVLSEPVDVLTLVEDGKAVLIDVRLGPDFSEVHATKAISIPLFQSIQTVSVSNAIKSVFYALNGVKGTEENPAFIDEVKKVSERRERSLAVQKKGTNRGWRCCC